jgi:UDP-N-acetyl-D-mannosaminuronic acid dehydrogenase
MFNTISVIGLGYIGLPTATLFASRRKTVIGIDVVPEVVQTINKGKIHIIEPDLDKLVSQVVGAGFLRAALQPEPAEAFLIAVPTPFKEDHKPDLSFVESAARRIAPVLRSGNLVVLESTSPVGTTEQVSAWLAECRPDLRFPQHAGEEADVQLAYCPERVLPGRVLHELVENDRIIGGMTQRASAMAVALYRSFVRGKCLTTDARTAEMCKLTENSFRDVNIAFANELSLICQRIGIDVWDLIQFANHHPRVKILQPGAGVGGHCIAVDPWFIVDRTPAEARLIRTAREVNDDKPRRILGQVARRLEELETTGQRKSRRELRVACLGMSFKPDIDDLRESPAVAIGAGIAGLGCEVLVAEPHITALPAALRRPNIRLADVESAVADADVVCVLVKHKAFADLRETIARKECVVDAVGLLAERRAAEERRSAGIDVDTYKARHSLERRTASERRIPAIQERDAARLHVRVLLNRKPGPAAPAQRA